MRSRKFGIDIILRLVLLQLITINGLDVDLTRMSATRQGLFKDPINFEILYTRNPDSLLDFNHAKQEIVVEVSSIHVLVSEERLRNIVLISPVWFLYSSSPSFGDREQQVPPRLEVLSSFMRTSVDISTGRIIFSFLAKAAEEKGVASMVSKKVLLEESMVAFLNFVSRFDLSFPHEDALSAAMQICIDRLAGEGLPLEHCWEATNSVLLNFLEDIAEARREEVGAGSHASGRNGSVNKDQQILRLAIRKSARRTVAMYIHNLEMDDSGVPLDDDVVIDFPDGVSLTSTAFFYDNHISLGIPTLFIATGDGVHLLRVTPPESASYEVSQAESEGGDSEKVENGLRSVFHRHPVQFGVTAQRFALDKDHRLGKGGLPLAILGTDVNADEAERRTREHLDDLEFGDVELLFARPVFHKVVTSLVQIFSPLDRFYEAVPNREGGRPSSKAIGSSLLATAASTSVLFLSDELGPFTRLVATELIGRRKRLVCRSGAEERTEQSISSSVRSLVILNLTPEGELFPTVISVLPSRVGSCLFANYEPNAEVKLAMHGLRIVLLRQFLNEILQYFVSGQYGFGRFFQHLKNQRSSHPNGRSFLRYQISLHDSSLILPRSSSSYEMVCVEVDETTIISSKPKESFVMPTDCTPLVVKDGDHVVRDCDNFDEVSSIFRKKVSIQGFRIFASLQGQDFKTGDMYDSPSFRFFFAIDGRAKAGKQVYCPIAAPDNIVEGYDISANSERAQRVWREITTRNSSLDIVIDNAPHLRILFCDPIDNSSKTEIELDLRLSHFCLLMSIWYSNMQELPLTFPFSALQLQRGSRPLHNATNYPDYGSEAFRSFLKAAVNLTIEVAVVLKKLSLRCTFDRDYAKGEGESAGVCGLCIGFHDAVIHTTKDCRGVFRLGSGSLSAFLVDESRSLSSVLSFGDITTRSNSWADLCFGIDRNRQQLSQELPQRFQLSVFMTPGWPTVYNLGMDIPLLTLSDFSPVFKFLEFFSSYFSDSKFGNLSFEAAERVKNIKEELRRMQTVDFLYVEKISKKGSSIDFRLWLTQPTLAIPCHPLERNGPGVRIKAGGGIWYKYSAIDSLSSHECVSDGLQLIFDDVCTSWKYGDGDNEGAGRYLIENLCLGFRLDTNSASNHKDLCLRLPFTDFAACEFTSQRISASPAVLAPPIICVPFKQPSRYLGPTVCEVTCIIEHLPSTWTALHNLFAGSSADLHVYGDLESATHDEEVSLSDEYGEKRQASCVLRDDDCATPESASIDKEDGTFSLVALVGDVRLFVLDPVLGPHLPVAVMSISSLSVTASQFAASLTVVDECIRGNAPPEDLQVSAAGHFWADYFKLGLTRSWEPLIESYRFNAIYEKSRFRGSGLLFNSDSCLQLIVSSALLVIFEEVFDGFSRLIRETFELDTSSTGVKEDTQLTQASDRLLLADSFLGSDIIHEMPLLLNKENRVAFSLRNITGQRIRILRPFGQLRMPTKLASLSYLDHAETTKLSFSPSISMVKNLQVTEVAYPGLPSSSLQNYKNVSSHTVDMQLQGFRWLEGIAVDTFGRSFANIIPRDPDVNAKIRNDWRLENVMKLLVEVGLKSGGRQVTIRSVFSLTNKTIHNVSLLIHPDPSFKCHDDHINAIGGNQVDQQTVYPSSMKKKSEIAPGESFQVPLLLLECALRQPGSHLGSIWIKPCLDSLDTKAFQSFHAENSGSDSDLHVGFSSKAIQLAKIIYESTMMFKSARGLDLASEDVKSGVQVSCPVIQHTGDRLAPFCYAVEIGRSPLVQARADADTDRSKKPDGEHRPVAYSLSIHPPFVIANLLPEKGRFELMHAVHRTVLWFGDLEAGQQVSVHSVGLDLPLLLFMNIGFAKTPVGEGALVHHGTDPPPGVRGKLGGMMIFVGFDLSVFSKAHYFTDTLVGLKSIGKAGKAVTKQLGKTLTSIAESPDQRGHQKLFLAQNPQLQSLKQKEGKRIKKAGAKSDLGLDTGTFIRLVVRTFFISFLFFKRFIHLVVIRPYGNRRS